MNSVLSTLESTATLFAGKDSVKAEGKAKDGQKVTKENSGEGVCARIATFVKNVFANILYYLSCTMIDFRAKPLMFKDSKVIHAFTAKMSDAELMAQIKGTFTKETLAKIDDRFLHEVAHAIKTAQKEGLATVEYRISFSDDKGLTLEVFAPSHLKTDKLPKLDKAQNETYGEAVKAGAWKKDQKVKVTKDREVTCSVKTISFNATKLPVRLPEDMGEAEEKLKEQAKEARDLEKAVKAAKGGKIAHPDDAPLEQQTRRVAALQTLLDQTNVANQGHRARAEEAQRVAQLNHDAAEAKRESLESLAKIYSADDLSGDEREWIANLVSQLRLKGIEASTLSFNPTDLAAGYVSLFIHESGDISVAKAVLAENKASFEATNLNPLGADFDIHVFNEAKGSGSIVLRFREDHPTQGKKEEVAAAEDSDSDTEEAEEEELHLATVAVPVDVPQALTEIKAHLTDEINRAFPEGTTRDKVVSHLDLFVDLAAKLRQLSEGIRLSIHKPTDNYPAYFYASLPVAQEAQGDIEAILAEHANILSDADSEMFDGDYELASHKDKGTQAHKDWGIAIDFQGEMFAKLAPEEEEI